MKTIIYSKENDQSVKRVKNLKKQHPSFVFLELDETEAIAKAQADHTVSIHELDKPKKKAAPANKKPAAAAPKKAAPKKKAAAKKKKAAAKK